jgi:hypothetical protein
VIHTRPQARYSESAATNKSTCQSRHAARSRLPWSRPPRDRHVPVVLTARRSNKFKSVGCQSGCQTARV